MEMKYIACFGDSLIEGYPFGTECSWCKIAEEGEDFRLLNYGVCGECCDEIFWRLEHTPLQENLYGIIFLGGANDALCGRPPQLTIQDIDRAAKFAAEHELRFAVVLPLISNDLELNRRLWEVTNLLKSKSYFFIDLQEGIGYGADELARAYVDGVHPTIATYAKMGMIAKPQIEKFLESE